jgi:hypothetical protein
MEIMFPSCWDGKNLDSANHQSHVAWPIGVRTTALSFPERTAHRLLQQRKRVRTDPVRKASPFASRHYFTKSGGAPTPGRIGGRRPRTRRSPLCCRPVIQRDIRYMVYVRLLRLRRWPLDLQT